MTNIADKLSQLKGQCRHHPQISIPSKGRHDYDEQTYRRLKWALEKFTRFVTETKRRRKKSFRKDKNVHYVTKGKGRHSCCMTALGLGREEYCDPLTIMLYWIFKGRVKVLMMYKKSMSILLLFLCTFPELLDNPCSRNNKALSLVHFFLWNYCRLNDMLNSSVCVAS